MEERNKPIGFFDSGVGGLTCVINTKRMLPNESIVFFGNTASAVALEALRMQYPDIPVIGCITPTSKEISKVCSPEDRIGVIATSATIESGAYERTINEDAPDFKVFSKACPTLVPMIEAGITEGQAIETVIKGYLDSFIEENDINVLVLGCTHYPLIKGSIKKLYPGLKIMSSSKEVATAIDMVLAARDLHSDDLGAQYEFYVSDKSDQVDALVKRFIEDESVEIKVKNI